MTESVADVGAVELTVPADPAYVSVLRTVTASLAARRDFTLDEIDDLRIAVDEASALLLPYAPAQTQLSAAFSGSTEHLHIVVGVALADAAGMPEFDKSSFAWMVLAALADTVDIAIVEDRLTLTLVKARGARG